MCYYKLSYFLETYRFTYNLTEWHHDIVIKFIIIFQGDGKPAAIEQDDLYDNVKRPQTQKLSNERLNQSSNRNGNTNERNQYDRPLNERIDVSKHRPTAISTRPVVTPRPAPRNGAWDIPPIQCYEPEDGVFYAQMGPTGGKQGYATITGHVHTDVKHYFK